MFKRVIYGNDNIEEPMDISPLSSPKSDLNIEKKVTISEYMNNKIEDPDMAIENLKKELEKSISKYDT